MKKAPIPENEEERLEALRSLRLLDTPPEEQFDRITRLALRVFEVPISTLTLVDADREWFKSCQGLPSKEGERAISFCGHALVEDDMLVVSDASKDPRFADNPMVVGEPHIRFYAGVPVKDMNGFRIGVFCIKDRKPRDFSDEDARLLRDLAEWAMLEIRLVQLQESLIRNERLRQVLAEELKEARDINRLVTRRELAMIELKKQVAELKKRLAACEGS